jgi:LRP1 type putative zinc finger protein
VGEGGRGTKIQRKAIRCRACCYSIVFNAHCVTSMADTDIDAVKKRKNAERKIK